MEKNAWQPIETAPKDGTFVVTATKSNLVRAWDYFPYPMKQKWDGSGWIAEDGRPYSPEPTHWMPIPEPKPS